MGRDYKIESSKDPIGWPKADVAWALRLGYSKAGLQNLRPSSGHWTLDMLVNNRPTHTPDVLDPLLKGLQDMYARGLMDTTDGYEPDAALLARRAKCVNKQSSKSGTISWQKPVGRASEEYESSKRSASMSSEKSSTCSSSERKSRSDKSHKPSPPGVEGARLSYDSSAHALLEHSNRSTLITTILDNRKSTMGGVCFGTCVVNTSDPPTLHSVMSSNSSSRSKHLFNLKGSQDKIMVMERYLKTRHAARKSTVSGVSNAQPTTLCTIRRHVSFFL